MGEIILFAVGMIAIVAFILNAKKSVRFRDFINLLFFLACGLLLQRNLAKESFYMLYALFGLVSINFVFAQLLSTQKAVLKVLVPLITGGLLVGFFRSEIIMYHGNEYLLGNKFLVIGAVLASLTYFFTDIKSRVIGKLFGVTNSQKLNRQILVVISMVAFFFGSFGLGLFGGFIIAAILLATSFFNVESKALPVGVLGLIMLTYLQQTSRSDSIVNLISTDILLGLILGVFGALFLQESHKYQNKLTLHLLGYFLIVLFGSGLMIAGLVNENMGGVDAFIAFTLGVTVVILFKGKVFMSVSTLGLLILIGSIIPPLIINEELVAFEEHKQVSEDAKNEVEVLALDGLEGLYTINPDSSSVSFVLGANNETKGAFKKVRGNIEFTKDLTDSKFSVKLLMEDFTTFNSFRDGSLKGDDYFNVDVFPSMKFESDKITILGDNKYEVNGVFSMLGVEKEQLITLERISINGNEKLIGKGVIDRTEFGMKPSATEGNIVTFNYTILIQ